MGKIIGIDLGISYFRVAAWDEQQQRPVIIPNSQGSYTTPSAVSIDEVGQIVVGEFARMNSVFYPENTVDHIARWMGSGRTFILKEQEYDPETLCAFILRYLKQCAEQYLGESVHEVVIAYPQYFSEEQKNAILKASQMARLDVCHLVDMPTATVIAYGVDNTLADNRRTFVVYNLDEYNLDISIVEVTSNNIETIKTYRNTYFDDIDFSEMVSRWLQWKIKQQYDINLSGDDVVKRRIKYEAKNVNKAFVDSAIVDIRIPFLTIIDNKPLNVSLQISRQRFELLIMPSLKKMLRYLDDALECIDKSYYGHVRDKIDGLLLVGGSTRLPIVRHIIADHLYKPIWCDRNPEHVVALGAAKVGATLRMAGVDTIGPAIQVNIPSDKVRYVIENEYPYPLAKLYRLIYSNQDHMSQIQLLIIMFEATLRYLSIIALCDYLSQVDRDPDTDRILNSGLLKSDLSADEWNKILNLTLNSYQGCEDKVFVEELCAFYFKEGGQQLINDLILKKDRIIEQRLHVTASQCKDFKIILMRLLQGIAFIKYYQLLNIRSFISSNHSTQTFSADLYVGCHDSFIQITGESDRALTCGCLLLADLNRKRVLYLSPFLLMSTCLTCKDEHLFFFKGTQGKQVLYETLCLIRSGGLEYHQLRSKKHLVTYRDLFSPLSLRPKLKEEFKVLHLPYAEISHRILPKGYRIGHRKAYEVVTFLRTGSLADVYQAIDVESKEKVALKILPFAYIRDVTIVERFRDEARMTLINAQVEKISTEQQMKEQVSQVELRELLSTYFSEGELLDLCFDLEIDYDILPGRGKGDKARELVVYCNRRGRIAELTSVCRRLRPNVEWKGTNQGNSYTQLQTNKLQHQKITNSYDFGEDLGDYYLVMELATGWRDSSGRLMLDLGEIEKPIDQIHAIDIALQVCEGLDYIHKQGIVHRDIKPSNILLYQGGEVKIADFGAAKSGRSPNLTITGLVMGTPEYMSPEQVQGKRDLSPASDLYSLGVVLYELLSGKVPFQATTPLATAIMHLRGKPKPLQVIKPDISPALEQIVLKMLSKNVKQRYRGALELYIDLVNLKAKL